ncbi:MAG: hypothetical protein HQK64_04515 [Desulfamplus sp.]|nr:hypothetical protein [Desulfamplus sp.]
MKQRCLICKNSVSNFSTPSSFTSSDDLSDNYGNNIEYRYYCHCCGIVTLDQQAANYIATDGSISSKDKSIISIYFRQRFENTNKELADEAIDTAKLIGVKDLEEIIRKYQPLAPLRKIENFLLVVERHAKSLGEFAKINNRLDYPQFYCNSPYELVSLISFIHKEELIDIKIFDAKGGAAQDLAEDSSFVMLTTKGLQRLKELRQDDKIELFVEGAVNLAQKADEEKLKAEAQKDEALKEVARLKSEIEMAHAAIEASQKDKEDITKEKELLEAELKHLLSIIAKLNKDIEADKKASDAKALKMVKEVEIQRDSALEKAAKYEAIIKKTTAVSEITLNRLKNEEELKERALKELEKVSFEKNRLQSELDAALKAKMVAQDELKKAMIQKKKAFDEALIAVEERRTAFLIAEKERQDREVAVDRMNAAFDALEQENSQKEMVISEERKIRAQLLKEKEQLIAELIAAKKVADNALIAIKRAEDEKKEAEAIARASIGKVMEAEYKLERALQSLNRAEAEKRDALKLAYGLC